MALPDHLPPELRRLLAREGLDPDLPPEVEAEARAIATRPGLDDPALADLTDKPFVTVDTAGARDLDQALLVEPHADGWVVSYAIADASWFVRPSTAAFAEALRRGSSLYAPGVFLPMLPRALSEDVASLKPHVDRRALVFRIVVARDGRAIDTEVVRGRVRSRARLTFDDVQSFYDTGRPPMRNPAITASLERLRDFGEARIALADRRDIVRPRRRDVSVRLRGRSLVFVGFTEQRPADRYNEELSVLCNVEGARLLAADGDVHPVYRTVPLDGGRGELARRLDAIVTTRRLGEEWRWRRADERLVDYLHRLPRRGPHGRLTHAIERLAMFRGEPTYTTAPEPHHGVGGAPYARFSAPLREVVGLYLHMEATSKLARAASEPAPPPDEALRDRVLAAGLRADALQRELDEVANRLALDSLLQADAYATRARRGTLVEIGAPGVIVRLDDPPVDLPVDRRALEVRYGPLTVAPGAVALHRADGTPALHLGDELVTQAIEREPSGRWDVRVLRSADG